MPDFEDIKGKLEQSLADIDRGLAEFVEPFSKPIDPPADPSMWTGAGFRPLSRSFLDEHRIPSRPKHYQLTADEAFPIDLPENYAGPRLRYYVPVSIRKLLGRQALAKSLGDSIVAAVRAQSGERNRTKYEAIKALLGGRKDEQDDRDSRECALFAMLGYRATPDFVVDASRAMTMEQLIEDIFDMRGRGTDFRLTVDLLTPGRAIYMEEFRGRQAEFLRGV